MPPLHCILTPLLTLMVSSQHVQINYTDWPGTVAAAWDSPIEHTHIHTLFWESFVLSIKITKVCSWCKSTWVMTVATSALKFTACVCVCPYLYVVRQQWEEAGSTHRIFCLVSFYSPHLGAARWASCNCNRAAFTPKHTHSVTKCHTPLKVYIKMLQ